MDKKIILSVLIVAIIGIVAATYQINGGDSMLNPLQNVKTQDSAVHDVLAASGSDPGDLQNALAPKSKGLNNQTHKTQSQSGINGSNHNSLPHITSTATTNRNPPKPQIKLKMDKTPIINKPADLDPPQNSTKLDNPQIIHTPKITSLKAHQIVQILLKEPGYSAGSPKYNSKTDTYTVPVTYNGINQGYVKLDAETGETIEAAIIGEAPNKTEAPTDIPDDT